MSVVINTNVDSTRIRNCLTNATTDLSKTMQRMSTGLKVNSAKDDASGCVISARMKVQLSGNEIAQKNIQNANSMLSTVEGNLDVIKDNLSRIRDLTLQAKNGTFSEDEIKAMDDEVQERILEINRISYSSKFSSLKLFNDGIAASAAEQPTTGLSAQGAMFQVGANAGEDNTIHADQSLFKSVEFSAMSGVRNFSLLKMYGNTTKPEITYGENDVTYGANASATPEVIGHDNKTEDDLTEFDKAVVAIDTAIDNITSRKSIVGSAGNRLDSAHDNLTTGYTNLESANSLIMDADIAADASKYTQNSILQQVSVALLAQANQAPSIATSLV